MEVRTTSSKGTRVTVDKLWSIELPADMVYSKDDEVVEGSAHRFFMAQYDDETVDFEKPYSTSFNFTVYLKQQYTHSDTDYSSLFVTKMLTKGTPLDVDGFEILMATEHVLVCYNEPKWIAESKSHHYKLHIFIDQYVYCAQIFFGQCKPLNCKGKKDKDNFVFDLLKAIRYVGEENLDYNKINRAKDYYQELLTEEEYQKEYQEAMKSILDDMFSSALGINVDVNYTDKDDIDDDEDDYFDYIAAEQAKAEIIDSLEEIKNSLEALGQQAQAMAEEARQREQAEIDEATKRGKYIPIEFKSNNIFPEGFAELLEQGKPYPKYYEHDFEIFVRRIKEIIPVDISDVPEDVLYKHEGRYTIDHVEYFAGRTVDLWNKYLLSLKGVETDFSVWQIEKWGIGYCDDIDKLIFELDDKFWLNGFVSEDEDFEFDKGILKKYKGKASNIVLPEGIIQFASSKFYNANKDISNVTSFTFPRTLKKFDTQSETPFPKMRNLTRVDVSDNNEIFSSVNGVLLNKDGTELLYYPIAKRDKEYTLPKTVTKVLLNVFTKNRYVEKIIVPGNVVEIGEGAFSNCINLKSVIFENGVKTIAKNAFKGCSSLEEIFIPESMEKFLMTSFQKCEALKVIYVPEGSKVMVNAEKMAAKFGAELVKYKAGESVEDVMKKAIPTNSTPKIRVAVNKAENDTISEKTIKQSVASKSTKVFTDEEKDELLMRYFEGENLTIEELNAIGANEDENKTQKSVDKASSQSSPVFEEAGEQQKESGCYIATAVYGSYDCPEVWTLRRFRDYCLASTFLGRLFIMLYYAISPTLVEWFGETKWFKKMWRSTLDKMVEKLEQKGYESTPYEDENY